MRGLHSPTLVVHVAQRVPPAWLNENQFESLADAGKISWGTLAALVDAGLYTPPTANWFVGLYFLSWKTTTLELLREAPTLIEKGMLPRDTIERALLHIFEAGGGKWFGLSEQLATTLAELSATGELDRGQLIDYSLGALARDFSASGASWFSGFHDRLAPTDEERNERANTYLRLLGSSIPRTVSFAVRKTAKLAKQQSVGPEDILRAIPPALQARQKGVVKRAAKLLQLAAIKVPTAAPAAINSAIEALVHPAVDVQKALLDVIDILMPLAGDEQERLGQQLGDSTDLLAPSLRSRLPDRAAKGEEGAAQSVEHVTSLPPMDPSLLLRRAETLEQALDMVGYALEHSDEPIAQERAFDAIARHALPPDDWATLGSPIRKRAQSIYKGKSMDVVQHALAYLAQAWTCEKKVDWESSTAADTLCDFSIYLGRIDRLADRVIEHKALPLLSTPTHQGGFIEPAAFYQRLKAWQLADASLDLHDAVLALMRLPAGIADGARAAMDLRSETSLELAAKPPECGFRFLIVSRGSGGHIFDTLEVEPTESFPEPKHCLELRHALLTADVYDVFGDLALVRWIATVTPSNLAAHFARGVSALFASDYELDDPQATGLYLEPARQSWVQLGETGHWLLMLCLAARGSGAIAVAIDVCIDGIVQERVKADMLGLVLAALMPTSILKAKRVATSLSQVAATSPKHANFVIAVIAGGLRGRPEDTPRDIGALLSLLYELLVANKGRLNDTGAREWLESQKRGGQVGKIRKSILSL